MSELPVVSSSDGTPLRDIQVSFDENHSETKPQLVIVRSQDIPDDFVSDLKAQKIDPDHNRMGEFHHFARVPTVFIEQMMKDGMDFNRASVKDICEWLKKKQLDAFIVSNKKLY